MIKRIIFLMLLAFALRPFDAAAIDPGDSCNVAIYLGGVADTSSGFIVDSRNEAWFSFQSIYPNAEITVTNLTATPGLYTKVVLYKGVCGGLAPLDSAEGFGDTIFTLFKKFLAPDVYYVKIWKP